ncbi:hypothetical protein F5Y14DRAFT_279165 [Nemania sp. NC0429]|nr:hypothetical protein F5Y14DRAFT_279165 [Nemania sp. NC0429]
MAQQRAAGWTINPAGSGIGGVNTSGNPTGFVGHVDHTTGSYLDGPATQESSYEHVGYTPGANVYGQQNHTSYTPQQQYSNMGFGVEGQPTFPHDIRSLGPPQVVGQPPNNDYPQSNAPYSNSQNLNFRQFHPQEVVGNYPEFAQQQQHVGLNDFPRNSWSEPQVQHGSSNLYAQGQQLYGNNPSILRMATASPAQSSTPKSEQSQSSYQDPASSYQPQPYNGAYQTPQSNEIRHNYPTHAPLSATLVSGKNNVNPTSSPASSAAAASHPMAWPSQGQAQRLSGVSIAPGSSHNTPPSVPRPPTTDQPKVGPKLSAPTNTATSTDVAIVVPRAGTPGQGWQSIRGCPNFFVGVAPVRRQIVTNTPGVKPHVAGDNRNGTRLLPLLQGPLPCEMLREKVRPIVKELKEISETIERTHNQLKAAAVGSDEHKAHANDLKKLETRKLGLESEKKKITGKAEVLKVGKNRSTGRSEAAEYDSESLTESSEEEDPQELIVQQIMALETRPTDPGMAAQYDVVRIIRREIDADRSVAPQGENEDQWSKVIGRRVADFGKYVVDLCAEARALREKKSNAPKSQLSQLQAAIERTYELVRISLETALEFGDEETLRNMGQHMKLMSGLTVALSRQYTSKTYNTGLSRTILRFISAATLMDLDVFNKVKLSTVLDKHRDNLDDEGKQLVAQISKNAEERTARNVAEKPTGTSQSKQKPLDNTKENHALPSQKMTASTVKSTNTASKLQASQSATAGVLDTARKETKNYSGLVSARKSTNQVDKPAIRALPAKRGRDDEVDFRATKKIAVESNVGGAGIGKLVPASVSNTITPPNSTSNNGQVRPRPSGSTVLNKSRAAPKPAAKKPESQSSMSSTISGLLAEIAKPAEKPKPQERVVKAPETPEERSRRLRKESRRGRTVTWKSDDELVQVRFFEHDSTEDEGRASNMIRDARDNRLEGQMLKQMQRSMQEGDDEDEDGNPTEEEIRSWVVPQSFDYSVLDISRRDTNYVTRGGTREIMSEQKKVMHEYENRELMTIYTTLSEIPDTPRSPPRSAPEPPSQPTQVVLPADNPKSQEVHRRWSETIQFGIDVASQSAVRRQGIFPNHGTNSTSAYYPSTGPTMAPSQSASEASMMTQEERDARVLSLLQSDRAKHYVDPTPFDPTNPKIVQPPATRDERVQMAFSIIQSVVDQYNDPSIQFTTSSRGLQSSLTQFNGNYAGYNHQQVAKAKSEEEPHQQQLQGYPRAAPQVPDQYAAILQQVQALQNPQASQNTTISQHTPAQPDNGVANLLATLSHSTQPAQAATQDANYAAWQAWAQSQAQSYALQSQVQSQSQNYPSYSQQYDSAPRDEATYGSHNQDYQNQREGGERGNRKEFLRGSKDHKGINRALIGTKPCTFWAKGQCAKGDNCTFRHDPNDLK